MGFIWTVLTGAPIPIFFGYEIIYVLSQPRPNSFDDYVSDSIAHDKYIKFILEIGPGPSRDRGRSLYLSNLDSNRVLPVLEVTIFIT
jgi:hypothetical protein